MVKASNYSVNYLILVLSFLILLTSYQGLARAFFKGTTIANPDCRNIYAAEAGDTCESLIESFNLKAEDFSNLNPNLNCEKIFVGEWLCINGVV
ncbi:hypothetical protein CQW23_17309 [Capsicum baccatum]|uniref:LysM domain-containing protein n=1 Tax=Capsicum baccatum TaxID=33114 RepID=A0A2G2WDD9_CAPBA|nr:hypothetical protein CQW23_17309 [Capsicum baccatum]